MRIPVQIAAWALMALMVGCASLGLVTPESFDERLAAAYTTNTAVRDAAANSFEAKSISVEDAEYILDQTRRNRAYLDTTRAVAGKGDTTTAEGRLTLVTNGLVALKTYLASQGVKVQQ